MEHKESYCASPSIYSSSSSPPSSSSFFSAAFAFFLRTRPGLPPPKGEVSAKSMCFCESKRTMNEGTLTICFPTLPGCLVKYGKRIWQGELPNVPLVDQDTSVMDTLCKTELVDAGLQPTLQEILDLQGKHVIQFHTGLVQHADAHKAADERIALEEALWVFFIEGQELTTRCVSGLLHERDNRMLNLPGSATNFGQRKGNTPHFALVP